MQVVWVVGGYVLELGPHVVHGEWSESEASQSSTWRELEAVYQVLCSYAQQLGGHAINGSQIARMLSV